MLIFFAALTIKNYAPTSFESSFNSISVTARGLRSDLFPKMIRMIYSPA